jgi:hypothetical protein
MKNIEIIVSRYNEDLKWTTEEPFNKFNYTVYNKGKNENFEKAKVTKIVPLENVGRCDHTFLYHIIENYNNLSEINVFLPGSINLEWKKEKAKNLLYKIMYFNEAVFLGSYSASVRNEFKNFSLDFWRATDSNNLSMNNEDTLKPSILRPFGKWFDYHFGNTTVKYYCINSIFSINKNDIIKHNIVRYHKLIYGLSLHSNPEVGHYCERGWGAIFYPLKFTKIIVG